MNFPKEYISDLLVRMSHHSTSIENNTITLPETVSIILHSTIPNKVSLREFYEVDNHRYAMEYVFDDEQLQAGLSIELVLETHRLLMDRLHHERGRFKSVDNVITGADFATAAPSETPVIMKQWIDNVNYRMGLNGSREEIIELACESHIEFERIHPFQDGNGRTGRLLMNYILLKEGMAPLIIEGREKGEYILYLANRDVAGFADYAKRKIEQEEQRLRAFQLNEYNSDTERG